MVSQGRTREALTSEWHWLQATLAWREPATSATCTNMERPSAAFRCCIGVAAHAIGVGHALGVENVAHLVGLVAVDAGGQDVALLSPKVRPGSSCGAPASICAWHLVQVAAMLRRLIEEFGSVCGRMLCGVWQETQVGGDDQALLEHGLAVNALRIVLQNVVLVDVAVRLDRRALAVAAVRRRRALSAERRPSSCL